MGGDGGKNLYSSYLSFEKSAVGDFTSTVPPRPSLCRVFFLRVEYAVVVVRLVQIQYTCVLEEKTRQNSARIFARVGHGEKGEGDEV